MSYAALENYLERLSSTDAGSRIWLDAAGRAQGRFFNATMTSVFQPVRRLDNDDIVGFEGLARSYSASDDGLSVWKLLDQAATDDESVELDRLCRMLHAINFFRQPAAGAADLFLNVHARLLAAVDGNHGIAFGRILNALELPQEKIVLQLPAVGEQQRWLLHYVADNYRRNGFRIAINAGGAGEALRLLERVQPDFVKVDGRHPSDERTTARLMTQADKLNVRLVFKRLENAATIAALRRLAIGHHVYGQGFAWDAPLAALDQCRAESDRATGRSRPAAVTV